MQARFQQAVQLGESSGADIQDLREAYFGLVSQSLHVMMAPMIAYGVLRDGLVPALTLSILRSLVEGRVLTS